MTHQYHIINSQPYAVEVSMEKPVIHKDALDVYNQKMEDYLTEWQTAPKFLILSPVPDNWVEGAEIVEGKDFRFQRQIKNTQSAWPFADKWHDCDQADYEHIGTFGGRERVRIICIPIPTDQTTEPK